MRLRNTLIPERILTHQSDRGRAILLRPRQVALGKAGSGPSVGSCADGYDNALAELVNGLFKVELIQRRTPQKTKESLEIVNLAPFCFNIYWQIEPILYISPAKAEARLL